MTNKAYNNMDNLKWNDDPKKEDMKNAAIRKLDLNLGKDHDTKMVLVDIPTCMHRYGGGRGINTEWACRRFNSFDNNEIDKKYLEENPGCLLEFDGHKVCWGFSINQYNYVNKDEILGTTSVSIQCNGQQVYNFNVREDIGYAASKAQYIMVKLQEEIPIYFGLKDFDKEVVGMKILYDKHPAVIYCYNVESHNICIELEDVKNYYERPTHSDETNGIYSELKIEKYLSVDILDPKLTWFR